MEWEERRREGRMRGGEGEGERAEWQRGCFVAFISVHQRSLEINHLPITISKVPGSEIIELGQSAV